MKTATWFDRTDWPADDPRWRDEPDRAEWRDEKTGLVCLARRGPGGQWCGYVAVPPGHPWHGIGYSECTIKCGEDWCDHTPEHIVQVHGGLTFAGPCMKHLAPPQGVCHVPEPGEPDDVWWFGFDCHHCFDYAPAHEARCRSIPDLPVRTAHSEDVYRPLDYVKEEITRLALALCP